MTTNAERLAEIRERDGVIDMPDWLRKLITDQAAEVERLRSEVEQEQKRCATVGSWLDDMQEHRNRLLAEVAQLRADKDTAEAKLRAVAMTKVWTNEDGKRFVFVDDLAAVLFDKAAGQ